jgi:hypothetical protein
MKQFGTTIQETVDALRPKLGRKGISARDAWVRICMSAILLVGGLYFAAKGDESNRKLGTTLIGFVTGYWFK